MCCFWFYTLWCSFITPIILWAWSHSLGHSALPLTVGCAWAPFSAHKADCGGPVSDSQSRRDDSGYWLSTSSNSRNASLDETTCRIRRNMNAEWGRTETRSLGLQPHQARVTSKELSGSPGSPWKPGKNWGTDSKPYRPQRRKQHPEKESVKSGVATIPKAGLLSFLLKILTQLQTTLLASARKM